MSDLFNRGKDLLFENSKTILFSIFILVGLSYGFSDFISMSKLFFGLLSLELIYFLIFDKTKEINVRIQEKVDEAKVSYEEYISKCETTLDEQYDTIKEYEQIFDSQVVTIPCNCGKNSFEGIFSPNEENICECDSCKNTYRVTVNFDPVLISVPMELDNH